MSIEIVYAKEPFPGSVIRTIFLAGPTPRGGGESWRPEMIKHLEELGYDGHVFVPEPRNREWSGSYLDQVEWEEEALNRADCIIFWVPRDIAGDRYGCPMPAFTTNDEWGTWKTSGKVVFGAPPEAEKVRYQLHYARKFGAPVATSMDRTARLAFGMTAGGIVRSGGAAQVPLHIYRKPEFQRWYWGLQAAGNRLDGARVLWNFRVPAPDFGGAVPKFTFLYALHVDIYVRAEDRNKRNEVVLFRPDVASVVLYRRGASLEDTKIILVREFRSPGRNTEALVYELPGGSSVTTVSPAVVAAREVEEETGLKLDAERLRLVGERQLYPTLLGHCCTLYAAELTDEELVYLEQQQAERAVHGVEVDGERTEVVICSYGQILREQLADWSVVGMIGQALV